MQDFTTGPLSRHLLKTTGFMLVTMVFQTLYFLVDLYWVGRLGTAAVAAVGIAGNLSFVVLGLTQILGVGTTAVISHAVGRKDHAAARLLFNQSQVLALVSGAAFLLIALALRTRYSAAMSADAETARLGDSYLSWFIPAMALQFALTAMSAALRATGNFKPGMLVSSVSVIINMALAPFLIFGWVTGHPFGVAGAAISTVIAVVIANVWLSTWFIRKDAYLHFNAAEWAPRLQHWKKMLAIGLPAGFEFGVTAAYIAIVYTVARPFGAAAQAGYGIGARVLQAGFMPVVALAFSVAPVAGQNFGARQAPRVKATFRDAAWMAIGAMLLWAAICQLAGSGFVRVFSKDPAAIAVGSEYLRLVSWAFVASALIFVASSTFQAMGNTVPSLLTSGSRLVLAAPVLLLARLPGFQLVWVWYLSIASVVIQLGLSMWLLRREFARRLDFATPAPQPAPG